MLSAVFSTYSNFQQIEFDGAVLIVKQTGDTLHSVMNEALANVRAKLYSTWLRVREFE